MKSKFVKNFSFLAISLFAIKLLGGLYRIPLANLLGSDGLGLYQMVFPLFSLFLTITSSAIPSSISKLVSDSKSDDVKISSIFVTARRYVLLASVAIAIILVLFSQTFAKMQGNIDAQIPYILIAPSIFFVGYIALYRGVYQGKLDMKPTAISQILEQVVKIALGLTFAYIFRATLLYAVYGTIIAVTLSEIVAFVYIKIKARKIVTKGVGKHDKRIAKSLLSLAVPMTVAFSLTPLITMVESRLILSNISSTLGALSDFGLYQGCTVTLISVPIALISALGVVLIPYLSNSKKDVYSISLRFALVILPIFGLGFLFFPNDIVDTLFGKFSAVEKATLVQLIQFSSLTVVLQGLHVLTTATLYGMGKAPVPLLSLLVGGVLKIALLFFVLPKYGIIVAVFSDWVCYFVALVLNLIYIIVRRKTSLPKGLFWSLGALYIVCGIELCVVTRFFHGFLGIAIGVVLVLITMAIFAMYSKIMSSCEKESVKNVLSKRRSENEN